MAARLREEFSKIWGENKPESSLSAVSGSLPRPDIRFENQRAMDNEQQMHATYDKAYV